MHRVAIGILVTLEIVQLRRCPATRSVIHVRSKVERVSCRNSGVLKRGALAHALY